MRECSIYVIDYCFFFCCRPWNWYFSGTTWSSESKADIFCCEWQWFQTFSRGISLVYNKHPLLNVFPQLKQFIDQKLVLNFVVSRRAIELAFELNLTFLTIQLLWCQLWEFGNGSTYNPQIDIFSILITILLDIVSILLGEILLWSFMRVKGWRK